MLKTRKTILFILLFLLSSPTVIPQETPNQKNVLILFAMSPSRPGYMILTEGIRTKLFEKYGDLLNLHMEYLEIEHYPKDKYPKERFDLYNDKYLEVGLDLLICVGIDIVPTVKKYAAPQLLDLPAICIDYDFSEIGYPSDMDLNRKTAKIPIQMNAWKSIENALSLFPNTETVYFISGVAQTDRFMLDLTRLAVKKMDPGIKITYLNELTMDEVLQTVRHLPDHCLIIVPNFNVDSKQVPYYNPEAIRLISQAANAPVFTYTDMGFGDGAIGGYIMSFNKTGLLAGETAVNILNGEDPESFIATEGDMYDLVFDYRALKRWNLLDSRLIPKESRIMFREVNFFGKYRLIITLGFLFLILQSFLIINLVRLNKKQKMVTGQLIESENKFRELIREDRILRLGQMTASLSHELNQPLTAILSTAQAGIRFVDSRNTDPELMKELFQNIVEDDKRTAAILSGIRGMLKLEKREKERVDLNKLIDEIVSIYKGEAVGKRINLAVKLSDQPVYILADGIQIQQVLLNLITNATQSIEMVNAEKREIVINESVDTEFVVVSVRDYGAGIGEQLKDNLFKPFVTSKKEGSGIGLAISHTIIDNHNGKIWAESLPDGGAVFSFRLKIDHNEQRKV